MKQVRDLILWLRKERIAYHTITIGGVTLEGVVDGKAQAAAPEKKPEPRKSMFEAYAGDLLQKPATPTDVVPEEAMED